MKLRSGKVLKKLPTKINILDKLDIQLEVMLNGIKKVTWENPKHARELLDIIGEANNTGYRFSVHDKIREVYKDYNEPQTNELSARAGMLLGFVVGEYPQYHNFIEEKIKNFDLESALIGNIAK